MIIVRLKGGLGNQMFQYALGRVLALKNNTGLVFNTESYLDKSKRPFGRYTIERNYDLDVFNIYERVASKKEIPFVHRMYFKGGLMLIFDAVRRRILRHKTQELYFKEFNSELLSLGSNIYLDGFFQSFKYFIGYEDIIKKDFTIKNQIPENVKKLKEEINGLESLCIFVRRKDFVGNKYHEVVDENYYERGLSILNKDINIDKVYVFSDDLNWCKENLNLKFNKEVMFVGNEYAGSKWELHMYLMSFCKYFVIANSTFAWWPAWLSEREGKTVIVPNKWVGDNSVDINDVMPLDWIKV